MKQSKKLSKILFARELRKEQTEAEQVLWQYLRDRNFFNTKFRRQHIHLGCILDFYCPEAKLAIEIDGCVHLKQKEYDIERQNIIEDSGIKVLRFKNKDVLGNIKEVLKTIKKNSTLLSAAGGEKGAKEKVNINPKIGMRERI
ncbi:MAG: endonuclease domain-containing protein, partial [Candidatus Margulisiibacteriota bacterium]